MPEASSKIGPVGVLICLAAVTSPPLAGWLIGGWGIGFLVFTPVMVAVWVLTLSLLAPIAAVLIRGRHYNSFVPLAALISIASLLASLALARFTYDTVTYLIGGPILMQSAAAALLFGAEIAGPERNRLRQAASFLPIVAMAAVFLATLSTFPRFRMLVLGDIGQARQSLSSNEGLEWGDARELLYDRDRAWLKEVAKEDTARGDRARGAFKWNE